MAKLRKQNQTAHPLQFLLVLSSDHISPATGLTPAVTLSKDGGAFAAAAGAVSEIGSGWYKLAGNATDANTLGALVLHATAATADPSDAEFQVVGFDPDDAVHLGLTALPNTACTANASLLTSGTGADQLSVAAGVASANAVKIAGQTASASGTITFPAATLASTTNIVPPWAVLRSGTAQGGTSGTITLDAGASASNTFFIDTAVILTGGTGAGQVRLTKTYVGSTKVLTPDTGWTTAPDNTSTFAIVPAAGVNFVKLQTDLIGSNSADSPAAATAQTSVTAIRAKTDQLTFASGLVTADVRAWEGMGVSLDGANLPVVSQSGWTALHSGTMQGAGGGANTFTDTAASTMANQFVGSLVVITGGTGAGMGAFRITANDGAGNFAVDRNWPVAPDSTSAYSILPDDGPAVDGGLRVDLVSAPNATALTAAANAMLDQAGAIETGWTVRQMLRTAARVLFGKSNANGSNFRDLADTKNAIVGTVDSGSSRTSVTIDQT